MKLDNNFQTLDTKVRRNVFFFFKYWDLVTYSRGEIKYYFSLDFLVRAKLIRKGMTRECLKSK